MSKAGERLFLSLYGATSYNISLDNQRYILFQKSLKNIAPKLESLPPTSASAAQHSFRTYYQVQVWCGNKELAPEQWGWMRWNGVLQTVKTTLEPAPDSILKLISCACKMNCSTQQCTCFKSGVKCSAICKVCEGTTCQNHYYEDLPDSRNNEDKVDDSSDSDWEYVNECRQHFRHTYYLHYALCKKILRIHFFGIENV